MFFGAVLRELLKRFSICDLILVSAMISFFLYFLMQRLNNLLISGYFLICFVFVFILMEIIIGFSFSIFCFLDLLYWKFLFTEKIDWNFLTLYFRACGNYCDALTNGARYYVQLVCGFFCNLFLKMYMLVSGGCESAVCSNWWSVFHLLFVVV